MAQRVREMGEQSQIMIKIENKMKVYCEWSRIVSLFLLLSPIGCTVSLEVYVYCPNKPCGLLLGGGGVMLLDPGVLSSCVDNAGFRLVGWGLRAAGCALWSLDVLSCMCSQECVTNWGHASIIAIGSVPCVVWRWSFVPDYESCGIWSLDACLC